MNRSNSKVATYLGMTAIGLGLVSNKWVLEFIFSSDGNIESTLSVILLAIMQTLLVGAGLYLIIRKPRINVPTKWDVALLSIAILVTVILVEVTLRIWLIHFSTDEKSRKFLLYTDMPTENYQWSSHHYLNYYPTPSYKSGLTYHNSLGYRSREFDRKKHKGIYRIVTLGGSSTYTISVEDNDKTFPYQLERILREDFGHQNIQVINAGVAGYNSWESLVNLQFRVLDIDPDLVIVYQGTNDVHTRLVSPDAYIGDNSGRRKQWSLPDVPLTEHSLLLRVVGRNLGLTRQVGLGTFVNADTYFGPGEDKWESNKHRAVDLLNKNPPIYFRRNLLNMVSIAKANNVEIGLATWAHSPNFDDYASTVAYQLAFEENNDVVKEVADEYGAFLFDFASVMSNEKKYWADGRHVNEVGALRKAELFADFINSSGLLGKATN